MKKKSFNKKLLLNKETISNLNRDEMKAAFGGVLPPPTRICVETDKTICLC